MLTALGPGCDPGAVASDEANVSWEQLLFYWWSSTVHPFRATQPHFGRSYGAGRRSWKGYMRCSRRPPLRELADPRKIHGSNS
jgi:hypothetical protein